MKIDKINRCIFNFLNHKPSLNKKEKADFSENNYSISPSGSKYWQAVTISSINPNDMQRIVRILKNLQNIDDLSFKDRFKTLSELQELDSELVKKLNLAQVINKLEKSISNVPVNSVSQKDKSAFFETFFKVPLDKSLSCFETTMKDSVSLLKNYKNGLELKYSRKDFLSDLEELNPDKETFFKLGIQPVFDDENLTGYDGFIMLDNIDKDSKLYDICHKFLYENEVKTNDENLNRELNAIIKGAPEFINIIGKTQHGTHDYSLDVHSLLVLAESINNPNYKNLSASDKAVLKTVCLLHDITKKEGVVDKEHQNLSSIYTKAISSRFFENEEAQDRIYELSKNHHWLEELNKSSDEQKTARKLALNFRRKNDFELAKIFADSDLKSVNDDFYYQYKDALNKADKVEKFIQNFYKTGNAVFVDTPVRNLLDEVNFDGYDYKVLNFNEIDDNEDLSKYGFEKGKTKKDVRFLVHMLDSFNMKKNLENINALTSSASEAVFSESVISPEKSETFNKRKFGLILSEVNTNLFSIHNSDQFSGFKKVFENVIHTSFNDSSSRKEYREALLKLLDADCSNEVYADFYKNYLSQKTKLSQIKDNDVIKLGSKVISGKELKKAIIDFQDSILNADSHNELIGCSPKIKGVIAKASSLEEVPSEVLKFARENNLAVVLIRDYT